MCVGPLAPKMPSYSPPPSASPQSAADVDAKASAAAAAERERQRLMAGRASMILTGGSGLADKGNVQVATLLG